MSVCVVVGESALALAFVCLLPCVLIVVIVWEKITYQIAPDNGHFIVFVQM